MTTQSPAGSPAPSTPSTQTTPVTFFGTGGEYFGVWIVNIALTIVTLGIYSAWAKVRNNRYFYGHTEVGGSSFEYLATGGQILKGRLIAIGAYLLVSLTSSFLPPVGLLLALAFFIAIPWLINAGLRFNARYSAYRGVRFRFEGSYWGAVKAFILYPILGVITLGIMLPHAAHYSARYIVTNHSFGNKHFKFDATAKQYQAVMYGLIIGMVASIALAMIGITQGVIFLGVVGYLAIYAIALAFKPMLFNVYWAGVNLEGNRFRANMGVGRFIWVLLSNSFVVAITLGLAYPWAKVRMAHLNANSLEFKDAGNLATIAASEAKERSAFGEELGEIYDVDVGFGI